MHGLGKQKHVFLRRVHIHTKQVIVVGCSRKYTPSALDSGSMCSNACRGEVSLHASLLGCCCFFTSKFALLTSQQGTVQATRQTTCYIYSSWCCCSAWLQLAAAGDAHQDWTHAIFCSCYMYR
jgi:hypothetical protein